MRDDAIHRILARRQFFVHLMFFMAMNAYLVSLWARSGAPDFWPVWPLLGWGIGIAAHASHLFGWQLPITEDRIQREINRDI
jgi:hypothetical protein